MMFQYAQVNLSVNYQINIPLNFAISDPSYFYKPSSNIKWLVTNTESKLYLWSDLVCSIFKEWNCLGWLGLICY